MIGKNLLRGSFWIAALALSSDLYAASGDTLGTKDVTVSAVVQGGVNFDTTEGVLDLIVGGAAATDKKAEFSVNSLGPTQYKVKLTGDGTNLTYDGGWKLKHETLDNTLAIKITCASLEGGDENLVGDGTTTYAPISGATANQTYEIATQIDTATTPIAGAPAGTYTGTLKISIIAT